jgi:hypothetical protein
MLLLRGCYSGRPCHFFWYGVGSPDRVILFLGYSKRFMVRLVTFFSFLGGWFLAGPRSGSEMLGFHLIGLRETGSTTGPFGYFLFCLVFGFWFSASGKSGFCLDFGLLMLGFLNFQGEGFRKQAQNLTVKSIFWRGSWGYIFPSLSVRYNAR